MVNSVLTRRSILGATAVAPALLAAPHLMVRAAQAQVPMPDVEPQGFSRHRIGAFEVTTLLDGGRPTEGPAETFGADQPAEAVADLLATHSLPADRWLNTFTPTLVNTGSELILFDTGLGEGGREAGAGRTRERLEASGYSASDVTHVVLTHFHGDHIGGTMEGSEPAYPNAQFVIGRAEWDFWTSPDRLSGPTENAARAVEARVRPFAEGAAMIGDGDSVASGITAMDAAGHTPGHLVFMLESEGQRLLLTADTANHYLVSLQRPEWHVRFDMDREQGAATRQRILDMIATDKLAFIGYHMPAPSIGFLEKMDTGYRYVPATYQFAL